MIANTPVTKESWFDLRLVKPDDTDILNTLYTTAIQTCLINAADSEYYSLPQHTRRALVVGDEEELQDLDKKQNMVVSCQIDILEKAADQGFTIASYSVVRDEPSLLGAAQLHETLGDRLAYGIVKLTDETNIPLELLLAKCDGRRTRIVKEVVTAQDAVIAMGVMERGAEAVLLSTRDTAEIRKMNTCIMEQKAGRIELVALDVVRIHHAGMGHRTCIDTTSLLTQEEGMIIGSSSKGGIFVCSETHFLPYMDLRPFRVNAGAVHSYVWGPDDGTAYLSDLEAGDRLLAVDIHGNTREAVVGRLKTEVRPLLLIEVRHGDSSFNTIIQDDWHVRVMGADGKPRNATKIGPGDQLMGYVCEPGRHVGIKINEFIEEK